MRSRRKAWAENLLCIALIAAAALGLFLPCLLGYRVPLDVQGALFMPPWEEARPAGMPAHEYNAGDVQTYSWYRFLNDAAAQDQSILWNPEEGFGAPFLALWRTRALSPFSLPFYFMPLHLALAVSAVLKLLIAGWCAYYASRRFGLRPAAALFAGLAFQMSGVLYLYPNHAISDVLPWLPLLVVFAERLLLGQLRAWPLGAVIIAVMALGGDPESLGALLVFFLLYLVVRRLRDRRRVYFAAALAGLFFALVFGLALAAPQLAPYAELLTQGKVRSLDGAGSLSLRDLPSLLSPIPAGSEESARLYAGVLPLLLLALWMGLRRFVSSAQRRRMEALVIAGAGMVALSLLTGLKPQGWPWPVSWSGKDFLIVHGLMLAFMAAATVEEWNELTPEECKACLARLLLWIPLVWGALFAGGAFGIFRQSGSLVSALHYLMIPCVAAVLLIALLGRTLLRPNVRVLGYGLSVLTVALSWWAFREMAPGTAAEQVFPETSFTASLKQANTRIAGSAALKQWPLSANGIPQAFNPSGVTLDRYAAFMAQWEKEPLLSRRMGSRELLLTKEDIQGPYAAIRPLLTIEEVFPAGAVLFGDLDAKPRARMTYRGRGVDELDPAQISAALPPILEGATLPAEDAGPVAEVTLPAPQQNDRVAVHIAPTRPGVLVLADAWYPGWQATVNGKPTEVFPVNGIFRGVEIGEGEHEVLFTYAPWPLRAGLYLSALAAFCIVVGMRPWTWLRRRHGRA